MDKNSVSILIVEDEEDLLDLYRESFEDDGLHVYTATSAKAGLEIFKTHRDIRLIISDSNLGEMSGIEFLKTLKAIYKTIPVFYHSTGALEQSEDYIKSLGGHGLVLKPFDLDEILIKIKKDLML